MRHDLSDVPDVPAPEGISLSPLSAADHTLLFEAYARSFADRPGFTLPIAASGWTSSSRTRTTAPTSPCWPPTSTSRWAS